METSTKHIDTINQLFQELETIDDLAYLLTFAGSLLYPSTNKPTKASHIGYYSNVKICKNRYKSFTIQKKNGGNRYINAPVKNYNAILKKLNYVLQIVATPHDKAMGFVPQKSIIDNARHHVGKRYVYNIDLKDFFHSFDKNRVKMAVWELWNFKDTKLKLAYIIASLCTHPFELEGKVRSILPQGSPTSPTLTNIICIKLDRRLEGLAKRFGITYTRYADDISFSSDHNVYNNLEFLNELSRIIEECHLVFSKKQNAIVEQGPMLRINNRKTRLQKRPYRQEVTGITVNEMVNVPRRYIKQLRQWIYFWERYGESKAEQLFRKNYIEDKGHVKDPRNRMESVIEGKLLYLAMVKGYNDSTYKKLQKRFDRLTEKKDNLNSVLTIWETEGIENAIQTLKLKEST